GKGPPLCRVARQGALHGSGTGRSSSSRRGNGGLVVIRPRRLAAGDRIRLLAPGSAFRPEQLEAGVAELARLGFEAVYDEGVLVRGRVEAGSAAHRAAALHAAWRDPSVSAVLAIRGGYGSQQLLPLLEPDIMRAGAKLLVGYSDVTSLLCWSCV